MDDRAQTNSHHRRRRVQACGLVTAGIIVGALAYWAWSYNNRVAKCAACYSYVSSLAGTLCKDYQNGTDIFGACDESWRQLDAQQYKALAADLIEHGYGFDGSLGHSKDPDTIFLDYWNRPLVIACRRGESATMEFCVRSRGPDGTLGTEDDIAVGPNIDKTSGRPE